MQLLTEKLDKTAFIFIIITGDIIISKESLTVGLLKFEDNFFARAHLCVLSHSPSSFNLKICLVNYKIRRNT